MDPHTFAIFRATAHSAAVVGSPLAAPARTAPQTGFPSPAGWPRRTGTRAGAARRRPAGSGPVSPCLRPDCDTPMSRPDVRHQLVRVRELLARLPESREASAAAVTGADAGHLPQPGGGGHLGPAVRAAICVSSALIWALISPGPSAAAPWRGAVPGSAGPRLAAARARPLRASRELIDLFLHRRLEWVRGQGLRQGEQGQPLAVQGSVLGLILARHWMLLRKLLACRGGASRAARRSASRATGVPQVYYTCRWVPRIQGAPAGAAASRVWMPESDVGEALAPEGFAGAGVRGGCRRACLWRCRCRAWGGACVSLLSCAPHSLANHRPAVRGEAPGRQRIPHRW